MFNAPAIAEIVQPAFGLTVFLLSLRKIFHEVLQSFYDEMLAQAMQSKAWAIQTGIVIEEVDINDLLVFQARVDAKNLVQCYAHLEDASLKHLESFQNELK